MKIPSRPTLASLSRHALFLCLALFTASAAAADVDLDQHQSGTKYSPLSQINAGNVGKLELAWTYHTGETPPKDLKNALVAFEDQPSMIDGNLVVCTVSRRLIALDPQTGKARWTFDPQDKVDRYKKCRGISHWVDTQAADGAICKSRIFLGTLDYRLIAVDAKTGKRCDGFGDHGEVKMPASEKPLFAGEVVATSKPAIVNDVVVVGSAIGDNQRVDAPSGRVLAYDARSGKALWQFDPVPHDPADPASKTWAKGSGDGFGGGNVWANMSADPALDLVYLPTTSSSSDFFGGDRGGDNHYTSGLVALKGKTGEVAWFFQFVHHNVFDYDTPSEPLLVDYPSPDGGTVPALVQNNKTGLIFVLDRATGKPLVPVVERPVPQTGAVPGEKLSKTQPFPQGMPTLAPQGFSPDDAWGFTPIDRWLCKREIEKHNYGPIYTPASEKGTIFSPSVGGGPNWGGGGYDPQSHIMVVPSNRVPTIVTLTPRKDAQLSKTQAIESTGSMTFDVTGSQWIPTVGPLLSPLGSPCSAPPWAALTAVDIVKKKIVWEVPLGSIEKQMPFKPPAFMHFDTNLGMPGAGGPLVTAGGLVFIGYSIDDYFRAFDLKTGKELWKTDLPAAGVAVPITYQVDGTQYVVITAGGHSMYGSTMGDSVVAYRLKK